MYRVDFNVNTVVYCGDALEVLKTLPSESVHCCITSPPYYHLRNYEIEGQLGLEKTPDLYIQKLVEVFHEVNRVLRKDGTTWINISDSYINKEMQLIPARLSLALQADGWHVRSEIIWQKTDPMPEAVTDRPTRSHEQIFLVTKSKDYFYNADAIKIPCITKAHSHGKSKQATQLKKIGRSGAADAAAREPDRVWGDSEYRNIRTIWSFNVASYKGAHCAVFPPELPKICLLAGSPSGGIVLDIFHGSGTTAIAAAENKRSYIGIELNPEYVKLSKERFETETKFPSTDLYTIFG
jgi:DNA modification methylase